MEAAQAGPAPGALTGTRLIEPVLRRQPCRPRGRARTMTAMEFWGGRRPTLEEVLAEGEELFARRGRIWSALRRITGRLSELGLDYALVGGLALIEHGYERFTEDIDLLVTPQGLSAIHERLVGLGWRPAVPGARKRIRDTEEGVRIDLIQAGEPIGGGAPASLSFPQPKDVAEDRSGMRVVSLECLIELKLLAGQNNPGRVRDLADVQELIRVRRLDEGFAQRLHAYVREKYLELCRGLRSAPPGPSDD